MILFIVAGATLLALAIIVLINRPIRDGQWYLHGDQMRRYIDGRWEYRPQTEAEHQEAFDQEIW
jgi:hypothetical protein